MGKYDSGVYFQNASKHQAAAARAVDRFNYAARVLRDARDIKTGHNEHDFASAWSAAVNAMASLAEVVDRSKVRPASMDMDAGEREALDFFREKKIGEYRYHPLPIQRNGEY